MAAEDGEGLMIIVRVFAYEGASKHGAPFDDCDAIALASEAMGGGETGEASSKNRDGLGVR